MSDTDDKFLDHCIQKQLEHMRINGQPGATTEDAYYALRSECGIDQDGNCSLVGTEYCDFECPFRD